MSHQANGKERTVGAFVNFGADYHGPGVIFFGGRGAVVLGEIDGSNTERLQSLHQLFLDFDDNSIPVPLDNGNNFVVEISVDCGENFMTVLTLDDSNVCAHLSEAGSKPEP